MKKAKQVAKAKTTTLQRRTWIDNYPGDTGYFSIDVEYGPECYGHCRTILHDQENTTTLDLYIGDKRGRIKAAKTLRRMAAMLTAAAETVEGIEEEK